MKTIAEIQQEAGGILLESPGFSQVSHFGNAGEEYHALRNSCGLSDGAGWSVIDVTGPEAHAFLHRLVSNEVASLQAGLGNHQLVLTPKGKIITDFWLLQHADWSRLVCPREGADALWEFLDRYLIMEEVTLNDRRDSLGVLMVHGPGSACTLGSHADGALPEQTGQHSETAIAGQNAMVARLSVNQGLGFFLISEEDQLAAIWQTLVQAGTKPVGEEALECTRIEDGAPRLGRELSEAIIPQEARLYDAISFHKGCYIGQETVARLEYRGHANKELTRFRLLTGDAPRSEISLHKDEKTVGQITSAAYSYREEAWLGLGYLRIKHKEAGNHITAQAADGSTFEAEVCPDPETPSQPV